MHERMYIIQLLVDLTEIYTKQGLDHPWVLTIINIIKLRHSVVVGGHLLR